MKWKDYEEGPRVFDLFQIPAGYQVMDMSEMPTPNGAGEGGGLPQ